MKKKHSDSDLALIEVDPGIIVPDGSAGELRFYCSQCGGPWALPYDQAGKMFVCSHPLRKQNGEIELDGFGKRVLCRSSLRIARYYHKNNLLLYDFKTHQLVGERLIHKAEEVVKEKKKKKEEPMPKREQGAKPSEALAHNIALRWECFFIGEFRPVKPGECYVVVDKEKSGRVVSNPTRRETDFSAWIAKPRWKKPIEPKPRRTLIRHGPVVFREKPPPLTSPFGEEGEEDVDLTMYRQVGAGTPYKGCFVQDPTDDGSMVKIESDEHGARFGSCKLFVLNDKAQKWVDEAEREKEESGERTTLIQIPFSDHDTKPDLRVPPQSASMSLEDLQAMREKILAGRSDSDNKRVDQQQEAVASEGEKMTEELGTPTSGQEDLEIEEVEMDEALDSLGGEPFEPIEHENEEEAASRSERIKRVAIHRRQDDQLSAASALSQNIQALASQLGTYQREVGGLRSALRDHPEIRLRVEDQQRKVESLEAELNKLKAEALDIIEAERHKYGREQEILEVLHQARNLLAGVGENAARIGELQGGIQLLTAEVRSAVARLDRLEVKTSHLDGDFELLLKALDE